MKSVWMVSALIGVMAAAGGAMAYDAATQIKARQDGMKAIGGATKGLFDTLSGDKDPAKIKANAARINQLAGQVGGWFPAGTGPSSGVKTKAKAEVWTDPQGFAAARQAFVAQAAKVNAAAQTGDVAKVQAEFGALRGTCKSCHDKYQSK